MLASQPRTGDAFFSWLTADPFEQVADLQYPQSVAMFTQMENDDSRIGSLLGVVAKPILKTTKRIDPNGASEEVAEFVSRNLNLPLVGEDKVRNAGRRRDRFSFEQHLAEAVSPTNLYGHSIFEQVYRHGDDGRFWIRKLAPRPQWTILKFNVAADGGLESITQKAPASTGKVLYGVEPADIPINRLVVYTREMRPGLWWGKSLIRSAYKHWVLKNQLMRVQAAAAQRNGMGVPVGIASTDEQDEIDAMKALASAYQVGMGSGVGLGLGQDLKLLGVEGTTLDIQSMLTFHDKMMALEPMAHFLNLDRGGSYALATVQQDPFTLAENAMLQYFIRIANEHIVEDLVDINYGVDVPAPLIVADEIGTKQEATAAGLKMFVEAGLLSPDVLVEQTLRQRLGLPAKSGDLVPPDEPATPPAQPTIEPASARARARGRSPKDRRKDPDGAMALW
ncbi:hypothetical protein QQA43_00885 [Mycolicibacterium vanbaalenii]|uniref:phage portal protein family protein n=1 Tax=Mycolicibacterium vanbaalenii TaxID=110539 RepID=UPI002877ABCB|nr:hypothetical protein [Mycolicibacterium vanbaalenii]WND57005.1 hypothetical protein QQA43_00885 [Mycolicibacterium vanbaalenii]